MDLLTKKVKISDRTLAQDVGGEFVILHLDTEHYYGLDEVGARLWQLLEAHEDLREISARLQQEYDVLPEALEADIRRILTEMEQAQLISIS